MFLILLFRIHTRKKIKKLNLEEIRICQYSILFKNIPYYAKIEDIVDHLENFLPGTTEQIE